MIEHAPVLLVAIPIVGAALVLLAGLATERAGWPIAALAASAHVALAGWLVATVAGWLGGGTATGRQISYEVGGFAAPYGIELVVDGLSAAVVALVSAVTLGVVAYARRAGPHTTTFYGLLCLLLAGLTGMTVTGDVFNLYVFLEITGLAAYALVATGEDESAAVAALKYLLIGTVGASLYLLGVGYLLVATGTLNMTDLAATLGTEALPYDSTLVTAAFALTIGGLAVKVALYPVHTWQPDAYATAPDSVSALISALVSTVAAYALARVLFSVFTTDFFAAVPLAQSALLLVAGVSVVAGSVLAVSQRDVRRMLAYSSVSQFGLVVAGFALATSTAVVGAVVHLVGHAVMKGGLFATAGIVERRSDATTIDEYAGLSGRAPVAAGVFAVLALGMVGVPPAVGFVGKWYLVVGALESGAWPIAVVLLLSTLLTLAYFARVVVSMYFSAPASVADPETAGDAESTAAAVADGGDDGVSAGMLAVVVVAAVLAVGLGLAVPGIEAALERSVDFLNA